MYVESTEKRTRHMHYIKYTRKHKNTCIQHMLQHRTLMLTSLHHVFAFTPYDLPVVFPSTDEIVFALILYGVHVYYPLILPYSHPTWPTLLSPEILSD